MLLFFGTTCPKLAKKKELSPVTPNTPEKKARRRFSFGAA
jgi:hypothetical protein